MPAGLQDWPAARDWKTRELTLKRDNRVLSQENKTLARQLEGLRAQMAAQEIPTGYPGQTPGDRPLTRNASGGVAQPRATSNGPSKVHTTVLPTHIRHVCFKVLPFSTVSQVNPPPK